MGVILIAYERESEQLALEQLAMSQAGDVAAGKGRDLHVELLATADARRPSSGRRAS